MDRRSNLSKEQWRSFSQHLDAALQLPVSERAALLAKLAAHEPQVAAEIERKLAAREHAAFDAFLRDSLLAGAAGAAPALVGKQVGPYLIELEIGRGGLGSVWRAHGIEQKSGSVVAIKFVHTYSLSQASEDRLRRREPLLGRLEHPNIVRLIDTGVFDVSQSYLVMEFVEGEPIDVYCDRLALGIEARLRLFCEVLAVVGYAHRHGVIHRALKPTNIYVTRNGVLKLFDFAVAKLLGEDAAAAATQNYALALRPQYAAPEQLSGHAVTAATDVYTLGLVLYLLLAGVPAITAEGLGTADVLRAAMKERSRPASDGTHVSIALRQQLKGDLDDIIATALKQDPSERYGSVDAFADDIRRHLAHRPVLAGRGKLAYRLVSFFRRVVVACSPSR